MSAFDPKADINVGRFELLARRQAFKGGHAVRYEMERLTFCREDRLLRAAILKDCPAFRSSKQLVANQASARSRVCRIPRRILALRRQPYRAAYRPLVHLWCTRILLPARA